MKHRWLAVVITVAMALLLFASCSLTTKRSTNQSLSGRMSLWHTLNGNEAEALNRVINSFTELNPEISVKVQVFSTTVELRDQFVASATTGFGPDLILAPSSWIQPLADSEMISPIDDHLTEDVVARFNPAIFAMHQIDGQSYGLPQSLDTLALYVNRQLVETPVNSFAALVEQANAGTTFLLPINFTDAFWGIQAFGGQLFNEEGQVILDRGGFANWLAWLRDARNAPGMIQDTNRDILRQRFIAGNAGYYIGYASELNGILTTLDPATVTVLPLPTGPVGPAGPFVTSRSFLFSNVSSQNQRHLAVELAKFITNGEQSGRMMRLVNHVPANTNVRINPRLYPTVAAFAGQARNGIPMPTRAEFDAVVRLGNEAYIRALEGGESPAEVAFAVSNSINEANGFAVQDAPSYACAGLGTIFVAHSWEQPDDLAALDQIIDNFRQACPLIIIETQPLAENAFPQQFPTAGESGFRATFALATQTQLAQLLAPELLAKSLDSIFGPEILQKFAPIGVDAMRSQGSLYGLPFALQVNALYYNRQLVTTPAQTLDDLRAQSMTGIPITLDTRFEEAFWGIRAFGGQLFAENGAAMLDQGGMADWLRWLAESRELYGIQLNSDGEEVRRRFLSGESAYYVAGADELTLLKEAMGEKLAVALLPGGPAGPAQPIVRAEGFVLREGVTEAPQNLALEFMRFATDVESQTILMTEASKVPANANVSTTDNPFFSVFVEQAQTGFLLPNTPYWQPVAALGQTAYEEVLDEKLDPAEVVADLTAAINRANGVVGVTPTPTPTPAETESEAAERELSENEDAAPATGTPAAEVEEESPESANPSEGTASPTPGAR